MPFQRANKPSSLAIVATVPNNPLYLDTPAPSNDPALFCSCSLTLAVSRGNVQNCNFTDSLDLVKTSSKYLKLTISVDGKEIQFYVQEQEKYLGKTSSGSANRENSGEWDLGCHWRRPKIVELRNREVMIQVNRKYMHDTAIKRDFTEIESWSNNSHSTVPTAGTHCWTTKKILWHLLIFRKKIGDINQVSTNPALFFLVKFIHCPNGLELIICPSLKKLCKVWSWIFYLILIYITYNIDFLIFTYRIDVIF